MVGFRDLVGVGIGPFSKKMAVKFIYSEKATKFCEISTVYLTGTTFNRTILRWRFRKILWPSQNI